MQLILNEEKLPILALEILKEFNNYDGNAYHNPYQKKIEVADEALDKFILQNGKIMANISNGKDYLVYEIVALSELIGRRYCMCKLVKDGKPYGVIYAKPLENFREKIINNY